MRGGRERGQHGTQDAAEDANAEADDAEDEAEARADDGDWEREDRIRALDPGAGADRAPSGGVGSMPPPRSLGPGEGATPMATFTARSRSCEHSRSSRLQ